MESPAGRAVPLKQRQASGSGVGAEEDISYGVGCNGARISPLSPPLVFVPRSVLARNPSAQSARPPRSQEHTSQLPSLRHLVWRRRLKNQEWSRPQGEWF